MISKKKADLTSILDDLRCDDPKKRLNAVVDIKEVAAVLGPNRVRTQLIAFLAQFIDDDENIVLELLNQLENFTNLVGGPEQEKCLLPLLISFCKTDEKKCAFKASSIMQRILSSSKDMAVETIKKMMKTDMTVAKQCGVQLIATLLPVVQPLEAATLQLVGSLATSQIPQNKIICAKYLQDILKNAKAKQEVGKMLDSIYNQGDELAKIYALKALADYYDVNSNSCLTKFKNLTVINSWRINIKICDHIEQISTKCTKAHFKLIFQPAILKFMTSTQPELRASSCQALSVLAKNMTQEEQKSKLLPIIKKLASDPVDFVKVQLSKNIVPLCANVSEQIMKQWLLPLIFSFIKDTNSQISLGVVKSFDYLSSKMSRDVLDDKIIKPLLQQLGTDNWRIKCQILEVLKGVIQNPAFLSEGVLKVLFSLTDDKIDAVRLKINKLIIEIISKSSKEWCDQNVIPKIASMKENANYSKRQNLLEIIDKTASYVSDKTLKEVYQNTIVVCLSDKVSNVKVKSIQILKSNGKLSTVAAEKLFQKLKQDKDLQVRELVKKLRA